MELRGAHKGGGRAALPRVRLVASLTSIPSLLDYVCSKKDPREGFILFGFCLIFLFCETLKQGKKQKLALGSCSDPTRMDQVSVLKCHPWIGMLTHTVLEDL